MTHAHFIFGRPGIAALLAIAASAVGCKSKESYALGDAGAAKAAVAEAAVSGGSCRVYTASAHVLATCIDYVGTDYTAANAPSVCTTNVRSGPSEYSAEACPTSDRVGSCAVNAGTTVATVWRTYPPNANDAQSGCASADGTWTAH